MALQCILAAPVLMAPILSAQSSARGVLKLTVEDVITHYALPANISLEGPQQLSVQANHAGRVSVKLEPGEYRVEVSAFGHKIARTHYKVRPGANLPFTIMLDPEIPPAEELPEAINAESRPGFTLLHGYTVDSETGQPLSGVRVRVVQENVRTQTDSEGHYDLLVPTPVPEYPGGAGTDTLTFEKPGYKEIIFENFVIAGKAMGGVALDMERGSGAIEHDATHKMMRDGPAGTATAVQRPFQQFPAMVRCAKPAPLKLKTPIAKNHVSKIRSAIHRCPNFAGHYTVVNWGCGTQCAVYVIVDNRTGEVYAPPQISRGISLGIAGPDFRPDSSLMVVANCPDPKLYGLKGCQRDFYRWDGSRLLRLESEPVIKAIKPHT